MCHSPPGERATPPRILKWELSQRPTGKKLDGVFTKRVSIDVVNVVSY